MRKHNGRSTLNLPTGRETRKAFPAYWRHTRNIRLLQSRLKTLIAARDRWEKLGYTATVAFIDAKIQCLTGILCGGYSLRKRALARIMGREAEAA